MTPTLSILVAALPDERKESFSWLVGELNRQYKNYFQADIIEILTDNAPRGTKTIGEKRNDLVKRAQGSYVLFIDDDDRPHPHYLHLLLEATKYNRDIITFDFDYYRDEVYEKTMSIHHQGTNDWCSIEASTTYRPSHRFTVNNMYYHLCAVKRELALSVKFIEANDMEDTDYTRRLFPLIKTEFHIDHSLLSVFYNSKKTPNV
jgi:glycosyltransferase involved in cell wall biosynthesis